MDPRQLPDYLFDPHVLYNVNFEQFKNAVAERWPFELQPVYHVYDQAKEQVNYWWVSLHPGLIWPITAAVVGTMVGVWIYDSIRGSRMPRHWERQRQVKQLLSDILVDTVEDARYKDKITRAEKHFLYRKFAEVFDDPNFLAIKNDPRAKRAAVRARRLPEHVKPNIPGDPPPPVVRAKAKPVVKRRGMSAAIAASKALATV